MIDHAEAVIHIVDDDEAMRTALSRLLKHAGYTVQVYVSAGDFLVAEPNPLPGCLLLDVELPGPSGLDLQHALQRRETPVPIIFISAYQDIPRTVLAIKAGASDFLLKPIDSQALLAAIESALAAHDGAAVEHATPLQSHVSLSEREQVVLGGIIAGRLNKQIAADLDLSERTIKSCRAELMRKFDAHSLAELVRRAEPFTRARADSLTRASAVLADPACPQGQFRCPTSR
ncbi:two component LuxR family transcriptional regulator [Caballeronia arvi]|uniref:Two component LuxR family transcriptional regulator n=1 Tax=Caballeronia arvi TaxID=1777135 RepID=A0A158GAR7_9BURK|nr:response regulator [Caballeronia arvi]SAL28931.1 two component LuxR family transcriptional regulator [Caballeronia arvi]